MMSEGAYVVHRAAKLFAPSIVELELLERDLTAAGHVLPFDSGATAPRPDVIAHVRELIALAVREALLAA